MANAHELGVGRHAAAIQPHPVHQDSKAMSCPPYRLCSGLEDAHKLGAVSAEIGAQLRSTRILEPGAAETRELHRQMVIIGSIVAMMTDAARLPAEDANAWGQLSELYSGMAAGSGGSGDGKPAEDHTRLLRRMVAPLLTNALRISNGSIAGDPACESAAKVVLSTSRCNATFLRLQHRYSTL